MIKIKNTSKNTTKFTLIQLMYFTHFGNTGIHNKNVTLIWEPL